MPKTITISDITVTGWGYSVDRQAVEVSYRILTDTGDTYRTERALFFATLPDPGPDGTLPDNYYELTAAEEQALTDVTAAVKTKLMALVEA